MNASPADALAESRSLEAKRTWTERGVGTVLLVSGTASVMTTAAIVIVLFKESFGFFRVVPLSRFLGDTQWTPLFAEKHFGIWPLVAGTLLTTAIAVAVALPLGLMAAIYLSEFAPARARRALKPALEILAGVPTVVYGYFALSFVTPVLQRVVPGVAGFSALSAGIIMGVMIFPIIASLSEDALFAVPTSFREAGYALGATQLQTILRVVVPTAFSGITAAVILAISRAIGETMIVAIAAGQQPRLTADPRGPVETMTAYIVQVSLGDTPAGTLEYQTIFAVGLALFVMTLGLNVMSLRLRRRMLRGGRA